MGGKNGFFYLTDGYMLTETPWNRSKTLSHYAIVSEHPFVEEYKKRLMDYSFRMILRKGRWDENLMDAVSFC